MSTQFKPILFSTPMVQAIIEGRKTQTRRVIKNIHPDSEYYPKLNLLGYTFLEPDGKIKVPEMASVIDGKYNVGDVLWVREKHKAMIDCETNEFAGYWYYADMPEKFHKEYKRKWKPSIHMPKAACRLFLRIKDVRVERLQDISEEDAINEGVDNWTWENMATPQNWLDYTDPFAPPLFTAYDSFCSLWDSINGEESWNANPWVWVIEFERVEKPTNF